MIALNPSKVREYVVLAERELPEAARTVFLWKLLPARRYYELQATKAEMNAQAPAAAARPTGAPAASPDGGGYKIALNPGAVEFEILKGCLVSVRNLRDEDGAPVAYSADWPDAQKEEFFTTLPPKVRHELAEAFSALHELTETDRGN